MLCITFSIKGAFWPAMSSIMVFYAFHVHSTLYCLIIDFSKNLYPDINEFNFLKVFWAPVKERTIMLGK